jgi:pyridoxamine 5'-phosphate oxidase
MEINKIRIDYGRHQLNDEGLESNPFNLFTLWLNEAINSKISEVNAMSLATANVRGRPSVRSVLLKGFDESGFVFYTNYKSRKSLEIENNPHVALLIFWKEFERQVRIEGIAEKVSETESDEYFNSRPVESKISAIVSLQSQVIDNRQQLERQWNEFYNKNDESNIQRPAYWGGYKVIPEKIEFWQGRTNRLHDRILYTRIRKEWKIKRLQP